MKTHELFVELLERSGMNPNALATALGGLVKQPQLHKFKKQLVREPNRTTMGPVADYYGVPVEAFYEEALAEKILADIASGVFVVKGNRRSPAWPPPTSNREVAASQPTTATAPTLAQALDIVIESVKALPMPARKALAEDFSLLAMAPGDAETRQRVLDQFPPGAQSTLTDHSAVKQTQISLRNQAQEQKAA